MSPTPASPISDERLHEYINTCLTVEGRQMARELLALRAGSRVAEAAIPIAEWCNKPGLIVRREWTGEKYVEYQMGDAMVNQYDAACRAARRPSEAGEALLPCPFCGCIDIRLDQQPGGLHVQCRSCFIMFPAVVRDPVAAWNRRASATGGEAGK